MTKQLGAGSASMPAAMPAFVNPMQEAMSYMVDAWQRSVLLADVLQKRSDEYRAHAEKIAPHVLKFDCEVVMDGRQLPRPVNYLLVRVKSDSADMRKRPFVVIDPRAGHGPGIGGFKSDSEIGVALKAGHPCYFIGFLPDPMPGQTIEDVAYAEAAFLERVIELHPEADGKPAVIGNCQAGWAVMMLAALRPELFGPIIVAGAPLSYWAGVKGSNPMRYTGGLLGGSWLAAMTGDLGKGIFDGAWLVSNFESLNPANTYWTKHYNLYSKVDTEAPRYLEFEKWWGGHVLMNAEEMQFIVDQLFVGNKLATGEIVTSDGARADLRRIKSPIVVFCSKGDNITPPQQALDWILDLYGSVDDIRAQGQTIVYAVHETVGHLGIFVSGSVAKKEHDEFASNIDLIDVLPPGLYEAVMTPKRSSEANAELIGGEYLVRFETRTLDDIRAMGTNSDEDERKFATVARLSEINLGLYRTLFQPWVQMWANEGAADWMRRMHPARIQYEMFSKDNPFMRSLEALAEGVRKDRQPVAGDNPFWQAQKYYSDWIINSLNAYRDVRDQMSEQYFHAFYGSPIVQALVGLKASDELPRKRPGEDAEHRAKLAQRIVELRDGISEGGAREAAIRAIVYVRMAEGAADERSFTLLRNMREEAGGGLSLQAFKTILREQYLMLVIDERRAMEAVPRMMEKDSALAAKMVDKARRILAAAGVSNKAAKVRLAEVEEIFRSVNMQKMRAPERPENTLHDLRSSANETKPRRHI